MKKDSVVNVIGMTAIMDVLVRKMKKCINVNCICTIIQKKLRNLIKLWKNGQNKKQKARINMSKLTKTSLAKRRASALNKLGAKPDTLAKYEHDIKVIENSSMSALKKKTAIEKISGRFVKSKTSTVSGIKDTFQKMKDAGMISKKGKAAIKSVSDMADYINASQVGRRFMEAKALGLASDQIKYAVDALKDMGLSPKKQSEHLYNIMAEITDMIIDNQQPPSTDVYDMIDDYINVLS